MKKTVGIALITLGLTSCGSTNYLPCPAYGSNTNEKLTEAEYYEVVASIYAPDCENCDEID